MQPRARMPSSRRAGARRGATPQRPRKAGKAYGCDTNIDSSITTLSDSKFATHTTASTLEQQQNQDRSSIIPYNDDPEMPLYAINQVPEYMQSNRFILRGYRAYYSTYQCIASLCRLHNETFNIWTHLLGGMVFVVLICGLFVRTLIPEYLRGRAPARPTGRENVSVTNDSSGDGESSAHFVIHGAQGRTVWPLLIFGFFSFACLACMMCSASYHLFTAHLSEPLYRWAHALDYFGITFLIVGSFLPFCYYLLLCEPFWRNTYLTMIMSFGVVGLLGPFFRHWTTDSFAPKKVLFYVCMVGSGIFPILHIRFLPFNTGAPYFGKLMTMMILYGAGVFVYAFKVPERWYPGVFDTYCSSHQIFHVLVLGAAVTHFLNCADMYNNKENIVCHA